MEPEQKAVGVTATQAARMEGLVWGGGDCREMSPNCNLFPSPTNSEHQVLQGVAGRCCRGREGGSQGSVGGGGGGGLIPALSDQSDPPSPTVRGEILPWRKPVSCKTFALKFFFRRLASHGNERGGGGVTTSETTADEAATELPRFKNQQRKNNKQHSKTKKKKER